MSPRTATTYRDGLKRWGHFLAVAGIDPYLETAEVLPDDVLEHVFRWMVESGYSCGTLETYLGGIKAFWRYGMAKRYVPQRFSYDAMRAGLAMIMGKHKVKSARVDPNLPRVVTYLDSLPLPDWSQRNGASRLELLRVRALIHVLLGLCRDTAKNRK